MPIYLWCIEARSPQPMCCPPKSAVAVVAVVYFRDVHRQASMPPLLMPPSARTVFRFSVQMFPAQRSAMTAASRAGTVTATALPETFTGSLPHLSSPLTNLPSSGFSEIVTGCACRVGLVTHR